MGVVAGLDAMDWKWRPQSYNLQAYTSSEGYKIEVTNPNFLALARFLIPHFYWAGNLKKINVVKIGYMFFAV